MAEGGIGIYEVLEEVGRGGMATVYRARHPGMDRIVALKVLRQSFAGDADAVARFQREARLIARLEHPHLLPVYDFDGAHDPPYIAMRYLECGTLKDLLRRGRLTLEECVHLLTQVASALEYAHRQGVVHRDIKPSNVMVDGDGNAFLADFGLARVAATEAWRETDLTLPGTVLGTPSYMAPEQAMGLGAVDHRADLYALGVVLFEMATGELPFPGDNPVAVAMAHAHRPVPTPSVLEPALPEAIDAMVSRALAKRPENRYDSAAEFSRDLARALDRPATGTAPLTLKAAVQESASRIQLQRAQRLDDATSSGSSAPRAAGARGDSQATPSGHHRLVTALFANLSECCEYLEEREAEPAGGELDALLERVAEVVEGAGGRVESRTGDTLLALWGAEVAREDDAQRAASAALKIRALLETLAPWAGPVPMQIGVATGRVHVRPGASSGRTLASGAAIGLARRLERVAPRGEILLSQDSYRLVREAFDGAPGAALPATERQPPLPTFALKARRPEALAGAGPAQDSGSGVTFRGAELEALRRAFLAAGRDGKTQMVAVVGPPGLGKSRLVSEFLGWLGRERLPYTVLTARATPEMQRQPYALLRALLLGHFCPAGEGGADAVRTRVVRETTNLAGGGGETAPVMAQLAGFGEAEVGVSTLSGSSARAYQERARHHLARYLSGLGRRAVVVIVLSDLHAADEGSLHVFDDLAAREARLPLLVVGAARPALFERVPGWGQACPSFLRLDLRPLSRRETAALVRDLMPGLGAIPEALLDFVVDRAEGNPLYVEELLQLLGEEGILTRENGGWRIQPERLSKLRVPATLAGLLQARLDGLLPSERVLLQRAAILGRTFWDEGVEALHEADGVAVEEVPSHMGGLVDQGLVEARETSALSGAAEFAFGSALLREVVLEGIPPRLSKAYHGLAARWIERRFPNQSSEWAAAIGDHFERAGEGAAAALYLRRAGEAALQVSAYADAAAFLERAEALLSGTADPEKADPSLRIHLAEALWHLGEYDAAASHLDRVLDTVRGPGTERLRADALFTLAQVLLSRGDLRAAERRFEESLDSAGVEDQWAQARALLGLGEVAWRSGGIEDARGHLEAGLMLSREVSDPLLTMACLQRLGAVARSSGALDAAVEYLEACKTMALEGEDRERLVEALGGLGEAQRDRGDSEAALEHLTEALALSEAIGLQDASVRLAIQVAFAESDLGRREAAAARFRAALLNAHARGETRNLLAATLGIASLAPEERARSLIRGVWHHPCADEAVRACARPLLRGLSMTEDQVAAEDPPSPLEAMLPPYLTQEA